MYDPGLVSGRVQQRLISSSHRPNGLRDPPNLLFNGCLGSFPGVKLQVVTLTTHLHVVPRLRMSGYIPPLFLYTFMAWSGRNLHLTFFLDPPRFLPNGYNEPRVLYPGIKWLGSAVKLMQKVNEEWGDTCIPIYVWRSEYLSMHTKESIHFPVPSPSFSISWPWLDRHNTPQLRMSSSYIVTHSIYRTVFTAGHGRP